jgi:hypothetical protein
MKKKILKLDVDRYFANRSVRLCSPAARAFLIDLKCLCVPSGRLVMNGMPLSDDQIAQLCGCTVGKVRDWLKELAAADAYDVDGGGLYFADMLKDPVLKRMAKVSSAKMKEKAEPVASFAVEKQEVKAPALDEKSKTAKAMVDKVALMPTPPKITAPAKKAAPWYKSPAGWIRMGQQHSISMAKDDAYESFQLRVARCLPDGEHLDYVTASVAKEVRAELERGKEAIKAAIPESLRGA